MWRSLAIAMACTVANMATAQSSLGIEGAELSFGGLQDERGAWQSQIEVGVDVAITPAHGLQGDLVFADTDGGLIGTLAAHIYMDPSPGQKYGLFLAVSDVDDRSLVWGSLGVEGMLELSETTLIEGHVGLGVADANGLDFVFMGGGVVRSVTDQIEIGATFDLVEYDEAALSAVGYDLALTTRYKPKGSAFDLYATIRRSGLVGRDDEPGETRIGLGVSFDFGATGGVRASTRPFRTVDPVAALVRRDLW